MKKRLIIIALAALALRCDRPEAVTDERGMTLSKAMGAVQSEEFDKAREPRTFSFPRDHGPHPGFRTEWWYLTGNLTSAEGRKLGYQFTIFRTALTRRKVQRPSGWGSNEIIMAHMAVTDIDGETFFHDERFSREGNGLAGAQAVPFRVWLEDWEMRASGPATLHDLPPLTVHAGTGTARISLALKALKPLVLHGQNGLSQKGPQGGNASYYYSYTRLETQGTITLDGRGWAVRGTSWMDREWSTSALSEGQSGWDWFALQLDDGTDVMYYQMRNNDGTPGAFSKGTVVSDDGSSVALTGNDVSLTVTDTWQSPAGVSYPSGWRLRIPSQEIDLAILPAVKNQLLDVSIDYWEGSVTIEGNRRGAACGGRGYVELTGY